MNNEPPPFSDDTLALPEFPAPGRPFIGANMTQAFVNMSMIPTPNDVSKVEIILLTISN